MNPSTKRYSKALSAAVNRDTEKSPVLLQCCSAADLSTAIGRPALDMLKCAEHARDLLSALRRKDLWDAFRKICRAQDFQIAPDLVLGALNTPQCQTPAANNASNFSEVEAAKD